LKLIYERPRPDLVPHVARVLTTSFPSGHATLSAIAYLTLTPPRESPFLSTLQSLFPEPGNLAYSVLLEHLQLAQAADRVSLAADVLASAARYAAVLIYDWLPTQNSTLRAGQWQSRQGLPQAIPKA
jgi:hypothetical protein